MCFNGASGQTLATVIFDRTKQTGLACLLLKGDWSEFAHTFAFHSWKHLDHPCFSCFCTQEVWRSAQGLTPIAGPWPRKTLADYQAACACCEQLRVLSRTQYITVKAALGPNNALTLDLPELALQKNDRVEPTPTMTSIHQFAAITEFPVTVLFWRPDRRQLTKHRNPIFNEEAGITPERCLVIDWLHCLSLGVFQKYLGFLFWCLFEANVYGIPKQLADHWKPTHKPVSIHPPPLNKKGRISSRLWSLLIFYMVFICL